MYNIVLYTNVLLVSISSKSKVHWIFEKLIKEEFNLCLTTEILSEYAEIIEQHMGRDVSENVLLTLENLPNVIFINNYFKFNLLEDKDDNKFVDCAISANAHYLVTEDKDFKILKTIKFPKVNVLNTKEFYQLTST